VLALLRWEVRACSSVDYSSQFKAGWTVKDKEFGVSPFCERKNRIWLPRQDSQDAWIFVAPLHLSVNSPWAFDFELGRPRCDNRIAQVEYCNFNGFYNDILPRLLNFCLCYKLVDR
jgi:hypothetical protein